jgi:hypothetical protein
MRPTELNFRSPKEKTPDAGYPVVTFDGRKLGYTNASIKTNLPQSTRFKQYEIEAKRTGYRVGPGAYNNNPKEIGRTRSRGTPVYKEFHGGKDVTNNGYFFYGNHLVFEPSLVMRSRSSRNNTECRVDASQLLTRPNTVNNFYKDLPSKRTNRSTRPLSAKSPYMVRTRNEA